ncbi:MAG TPA: VOC family protein [Chloroflexota bacterium]|nr:VOC family protein [Chloroflexota bacterium]
MEEFLEIDHTVLAVNDLILAERFYCDVLGEIFGYGRIEDRSGLTTDEIIRGKRLREMRGTTGSGNVIAPHSSVRVGETLIPLFLYQEHVQEPPPEQMRGTPRIALTVSTDELERAIDVLSRCDIPFEGPVEHPAPCPVAQSIYLKDPSSNFIELACPRE